MAKNDANSLTASLEHVVIFTDGSKIRDSTTAAAAWCKNTDKSLAKHLGTARTHGIFQAEYQGVQMGLTLALRTASPHTRRVSILLENQSVIKDLRSNKLPITMLDDRKETYKLMTYLHRSFPNMRICIRWCPGHAGVHGNEIVDKIANQKAKTKLPNTFVTNPSASGFITAIKEWRTKNSEPAAIEDLKRLGHKPQGTQHLEHLSKLRKHSIAAITQLRSGHIPLNHYLCRFDQLGDPSCGCQEGIETVEHLLFTCNRYIDERQQLKDELSKLNLRPTTSVLNEPIAFEAIASYCDSTWRLKDRWSWARISGENLPADRQPPRV